MRKSIQEVINLLDSRPHQTENQIMDLCWGFTRKTPSGWTATNKSYADLIRRGLNKGLIDRTDISKVDPGIRAINGWGRAKFIYHLPQDPYFTDEVNCY